YCKVTDDRLAGAALRAMAKEQNDRGSGELRFYPTRYAKTFQTWHENIRDWCISRQLWWGHRIPVWSKRCSSPQEANDLTVDLMMNLPVLGDASEAVVRADGDMVYACIMEDARKTLEYLSFRELSQDPDVLDT